MFQKISIQSIILKFWFRIKFLFTHTSFFDFVAKNMKVLAQSKHEPHRCFKYFSPFLLQSTILERGSSF